MRIYYLLIINTLLFISCGNKVNEEERAITPVLESVSIENGSIQKVTLGQISIVYSVPVELSARAADLFKEVGVTGQTLNKSLIISFGQLEYDTEYNFVLPEGVVVSKATKSAAASYRIYFSTEKATLTNPDLEAELSWNISPSLSNKNADEGAKELYHFLSDNFGKKMISCAMSEVNWNIDNAEWIYEQTGEWPAMVCFDLIHYTRRGTSYDNWVKYDDIVNNAISYSNKGGIISLMWHWLDPTRTTDAFYTPMTGNNEVTTFDPSSIFDTQSAGYKAMIADIDEISTHLKKLQDAGVPVLWRPLHEAAGNRYGAWFWWGTKGAESCKQIWNVMYDRLVNHHGLNNLIWVWTVNVESFDQWYNDGNLWYPGDEKVDIISIDIYDDNVKHGSQLELFKKTALIGGCKKITTLAECGYIPDPDISIKNGEVWSWFMPWYGDFTKVEKYNGPTWWKKVMNSDYVITLSDMN